MSASSAFTYFEQGKENLSAAILSGAPPFERLQHPAFCSVGESNQAGADDAKTWINTVNALLPESDIFQITSGLDLPTLVRAFGPVQFKDGERLPIWVEDLLLTIRLLPKSDCEGQTNVDPSAAITLALMQPVIHLLDWDSLCLHFPFINSSVLPLLTRQLATRILLVSWSILELETSTQQTDTWDMNQGAWIDRLCNFTGLTFVVGTAIRQWRQNTLEIFTRLNNDLPHLNQMLFKNLSLKKLVSIESDCGDRHNDGRSVSILTFSDGQKLVYKPKDLRCSFEFLELIQFLNKESKSIELPTRQIICRAQYAWEEFVKEKVATSKIEIKGLFRRFGMMLRILQLVEGRDFWIDNLRINGDLPVFIDLECILHPRFKINDRSHNIMGLDPDLYTESVLATGAITEPVDIPNGGRQDFGALSQSGIRQLPIGTLDGYRDRENGNFWLKGGQFYWEPQIAWPSLDGQPVDPADNLDDLELGYREMQDVLKNKASDLLGTKNKLRGLEQAPVRVLMRSTWEYLVFLRSSLEPVALLNGNSREIALAKVLSTAPAWVNDSKKAERFAITNAELNFLRMLDVPHFQCVPVNSGIILQDNSLVADNIFEGTAHARFIKRLTEIDGFDIETHLDILRTTLKEMKAAKSTNTPII